MHNYDAQRLKIYSAAKCVKFAA